MAKEVAKSLNTECARREGPECLIPVGKEPLSRGVLRKILAAPEGLNLHNRTVPRLLWGYWFGLSLRAMLCVAASGGFRKAELCLDANTTFDAMHMSRASLFWVIRGVVVRCPSDDQLRALQEGDKAGLLACPAKNDPWGVHFMPHPLFFSYHSNGVDNTAARLRDMLLGCLISPELMRSTPLFSFGPGAGPKAKPLRHQCMDTVLKALLRTFLEEARARRDSWHSFRIGLACSLLAAGASESVILALCRWRSPESLRVYARLNSSVYAAWVDSAGAQALDSVQAPNLPELAQTAGQAPELGCQGVPGAFHPGVYDFLERLEQSEQSPSAADLLVLRPPEIDSDRYVSELNSLDFNTEPEMDCDDDETNAATLPWL